MKEVELQCMDRLPTQLPAVSTQDSLLGSQDIFPSPEGFGTGWAFP